MWPFVNNKLFHRWNVQLDNNFNDVSATHALVVITAQCDLNKVAVNECIALFAVEINEFANIEFWADRLIPSVL